MKDRKTRRCSTFFLFLSELIPPTISEDVRIADAQVPHADETALDGGGETSSVITHAVYESPDSLIIVFPSRFPPLLCSHDAISARTREGREQSTLVSLNHVLPLSNMMPYRHPAASSPTPCCHPSVPGICFAFFCCSVPSSPVSMFLHFILFSNPHSLSLSPTANEKRSGVSNFLSLSLVSDSMPDLNFDYIQCLCVYCCVVSFSLPVVPILCHVVTNGTLSLSLSRPPPHTVNKNEVRMCRMEDDVIYGVLGDRK